jgi:hypothetical protein
VLVALARAAVLAENEECEKSSSALCFGEFTIHYSREKVEQRRAYKPHRGGDGDYEICVQVRVSLPLRMTCLPPASELPTYDRVIPALLTHGISNLRSTCKLTPGVPLKPMLAKPTKAIGEVLDRFENKRFTCEYKYDGERAQVHKLDDGVVGVFSRNSEDMSKKYPDLVEQLSHVGGFLFGYDRFFLTPT